MAVKSPPETGSEGARLNEDRSGRRSFIQIPHIPRCTLSAAYLKLGKLAESAANISLIRDPRSAKARYRRAIARKERGRLAEALVNLTSLLTTAPGSIEASTAIEEISGIYAASGHNRISLEDVVRKPLSTDPRLPPDIPAERLSAALVFVGPKKTIEERKEMKTCQKCKRATYCNATCQRGDWAGHKTTYNRPADNNLTFHLGRQLVDRVDISTHLAAYAVHAMGPAGMSATRSGLVMINMVPLIQDPARKRIRIKHLLPASLAVLPPEVSQRNTDMLREQTALLRSVHQPFPP
ncbi:hypothetical protein B0H16DRAFT_1740068 [Mycena metata]|uniref:MYND-type domain-containing protein n=1 Tax=Mycena metata TaxID=1033252 RepID=A0AAD7HES1_9AGAR|nr:hypothetical protein B0H16DRAFT_1740068 [Mycena metata]